MDDVTRAMSRGGGGGGVLVNVQEWGCFSNFLRADDVQGGGVLVKNPVSVSGPPPPFKNPGSAPVDTRLCRPISKISGGFKGGGVTPLEVLLLGNRPI